VRKAKIKIPYLEGMLAPETLLWALANNAELCPLEPGDESYYWAFREWWLDPEPGDLIIVEQDIVPPENVVFDFTTCPEHWCASWYELHPVTEDGRDYSQAIPFGWGLGCTRFSAVLRREYPELADRAGEPLVFGPEPDPDPPRVWWVLDMRVTMHVNRLGYLPHDHGQAQHVSCGDGHRDAQGLRPGQPGDLPRAHP